jgi:hypothetical protein
MGSALDQLCGAPHNLSIVKFTVWSPWFFLPALPPAMLFHVRKPAWCRAGAGGGRRGIIV